MKSIYLLIFIILNSIIIQANEVSISGAMRVGKVYYSITGKIIYDKENVKEYSLQIMRGETIHTKVKVDFNRSNIQINGEPLRRLPPKLINEWKNQLNHCVLVLESDQNKFLVSESSKIKKYSTSKVSNIEDKLPGMIEFEFLSEKRQSMRISKNSLPIRIVFYSLTEWNNSFQDDLLLNLTFNGGKL